MKFPFNLWGLPDGVSIARRTLTPTDHFAAVKVATACDVDWGDGTPIEKALANTQLNHQYAFTSGEVEVRVSALSPAATNPNFAVKHPSSPSVDAGWSEITIRDPHMVDFTVKPNSLLKRISLEGRSKWGSAFPPTNLNEIPSVEEIHIGTILPHPNQNSFYGLCQNNTNLKRFTCLTPLPIGHDSINAFLGCTNLELVQWDWSGVRDANYMFKQCDLKSVSIDAPHMIRAAMFEKAGINTANITNTIKLDVGILFTDSAIVTVNRMDLPVSARATMFIRCLSLVHYPGFNGEATTDFSYMFYEAANLETIGDMGMANATNVAQMFTRCPKVTSLTLRGLKVSIQINAMNLSAAALDAVFTSLGTANAGATINISGNPGAATCNKTIAINKSWVVTG